MHNSLHTKLHSTLACRGLVDALARLWMSSNRSRYGSVHGAWRRLPSRNTLVGKNSSSFKKISSA
jgi:hypothetical protein